MAELRKRAKNQSHRIDEDLDEARVLDEQGGLKFRHLLPHWLNKSISRAGRGYQWPTATSYES